jgi:hypothetical protein
VRAPTLKDFLSRTADEVHTHAWLITNREPLICEWAIGMGPDQGQLPGASGRAFATWLSNGWPDWAEDPETPVCHVLEKAVIEWSGGRTF